MDGERGQASVAIIGVILFSLIVIFGMWGCPQYSVYEKRMQGQAMLAKAESDKQIQIQDAKSKLEAAKMLAAAEVERSKGVAEANKIIGDSLRGNESYLRWLWISNLEDKEKTGSVIYIPTEAGLPILEAGKR